MTPPRDGHRLRSYLVTRKRWWLAGAAAALLLVLGGLGLWWARSFQALAVAGKAAASAGMTQLQAKQPDASLASFQTAQQKFAQAEAMLGPGWLQVVPVLGHQVAAADDLTSIGSAGSAAGIEAASLYRDIAAAPHGGNRLSTLFTLAHPHLDAALVQLVEVQQHYQNLSPAWLLPPLADAVTQAKDLLDPMAGTLAHAQSLLQVERYLFSGEHRFLVVSQSSGELRPTGGFMGTYGLVTIGPSGFTMSKYADIFTLPDGTLNLPKPPGRAPYRQFLFRDANWWVDFPTSSQVMLQFWQNMSQPEVDGIIALDFPAIRDLLTVFGPITVKESATPISADNMFDVLTTIVEGETAGKGHDRKNVVASLANGLIERITHMDDASFVPTVRSLAESVSGKHVQWYFTDDPTQSAAVDAGWAGAVDPPKDTTDLLAAVNAVVPQSKANMGVTKTIDYQVNLAADGSAQTDLTLGYVKDSTIVPKLKRQWFGDSLRIHRITGTEHVAGSADQAGLAAIDDRIGLPTWSGYFTLDPGKSTSVRFASTVPNALRQGTAAALPAGPATGSAGTGSWHYRLLLVKQADLFDAKATVTVDAPAGWSVSGAVAYWRSSGTVVPSTTTSTQVVVGHPLEQDLVLDVTLTSAP